MSADQIDPISPIEIEHQIDEIWIGDILEQYYNFIDYHFEIDGAYCRARAYADDFREVTLFGPFNGREREQVIQNPDFERDVSVYLERRFLSVSRL